MPRVIRPGADQPQAARGKQTRKPRENEHHYEGITKHSKYDTRPGMVDVQQARAGKGLIVAGWICWPIGIVTFLSFAGMGLGESAWLPLIIGLLVIVGPAMHTLGRLINWWNWG